MERGQFAPPAPRASANATLRANRRQVLQSCGAALAVAMAGARLVGSSTPARAAQESSALPNGYESEAQTYFAALTNAGAAPSRRRKYTYNRCIKRLKERALWPKLTGLWFVGDTESAWQLDLTRQYDLTRVGAPKFTTNSSVTTANTNDYYDTGIQFKSLAQNDVSIGLYTTTAGSFATSDMGVTEDGIALAIESKGSDALLRSAAFSASASGGLASQWPGDGFNAISRRGPTEFSAYHYGIRMAEIPSVSCETTSSNTVCILKASGATGFSGRAIQAAFVAKGLRDEEMSHLGAIIKSTVDSIMTGEVDIQEPGEGDQVVNCDVAVYGATLAGVIAAYQLKRQGRSVAIIGSPRERTVTHIGGMPANGLGWIDAKLCSTVNGIVREMITWANRQAGLRDITSQSGLSIQPRLWNLCCRMMLDPDRNDASLPGKDVPIYWSEGIASISKTGATITALRTKDGRIVNCSQVIGCDYEGDLLPLAGVSYTEGADAAGPGRGEIRDGFSALDVLLPGDSETKNKYRLDPYLVPGDRSSGLLPDLATMPAVADGAADPSLEAMSYRIIVTNDPSRKAPMTGGGTYAQPPNYNPQRYELLGRYLAACTAAGHTPTLNDILTRDRQVNGATKTIFDWNSGPGIGTDLPQSGIRWLKAASDAEREAIIKDIREFTQGLFYWLKSSADSRIPAALVTDLNSYGLDATSFLDPHENDPLFWPGMIYRRDPVYQMRNTFNYNGNDTFAPDHTLPRSWKTVGCASYSADRHSPRRIGYDAGNGAAVYNQGGIQDGSATGRNRYAPIPLEAIVPDKTECPNLIYVTSPAVTKIAWYSVRMEACMGLLAQSAAIIADHAISEGVAVQDIDYVAFLTEALAVPDASTPVLPQTN